MINISRDWRRNPDSVNVLKHIAEEFGRGAEAHGEQRLR
jgi:hypothetical protein